MIRDRRQEDLDRLCAILSTMKRPSSLRPGQGLRDWLEEHDAERSWVFDMAPVTVAPTKNVVAHVQIRSLTEDHSSAWLVEHLQRPASSLLAIGRLFVKPDTFEQGIGRFLLRESVSHIKDRGKLAVLDPGENEFPDEGFYQRFGFHDIPAGAPGATPLIYTR